MTKDSDTPKPTPSEPLPLVEGKLFIEYLHEQFPATVGHKPIIAWLTQVATALERAEQERDEVNKLLLDPKAVHVNTLRGTIAMLSDENVRHVYPHLFRDTAKLHELARIAKRYRKPATADEVGSIDADFDAFRDDPNNKEWFE